MIRRLPAAALLLAAAASFAGPAAAQDRPLGGEPPKRPNDLDAPLPIRVNQAIDSGVAWLRTKQFKQSGNWDPEVTASGTYDPAGKGASWCHPTGTTALALYTLLKCDVPKDDPGIKRGFEWLQKRSANTVRGGSYVWPNRVPNGTYEIATLILALEAKANPHKREKERERDLRFRLKKGEKLKTAVKLDPEDEAWMKDLVAALVQRWNKGKAWRYGHIGQDKKLDQGYKYSNDLSATQLAMLAIFAAERCGLHQSDDLYLKVLQWTLTMQEPEGPEVDRWNPSISKGETYAPSKDRARGFGYAGTGAADQHEKVTGSMTACGLANIVICTSVLEARESKAFTTELAAKAEKAWWDGIAWMDYNWSVSHNINRGGHHYYYLYCLERACDLKGINLVASHPWYNEGAQVLVDEQLNESSGAWTKPDTYGPCDVLNTCFALLFLNRSTPAITGD